MSMIEQRQIEVPPDLVFDALSGGREGAPLVLLLHGFPESMHMWRAQVPALASPAISRWRRTSAAIRRVRDRT
jgi:pimeloyl-ACP methyl ester carboxylesterase